MVPRLLFAVFIILIIILKFSCDSVSGTFCMDLVISNGSGEQEITASVDVKNNKIISLRHAGKTINLRDQDVNIYKVDKDYNATGADIDDFVYNGEMSTVRAESIIVLDVDEQCK